MKEFARRIVFSKFFQKLISVCNSATIRTLVFVRYMDTLNQFLETKGFMAKISIRPINSLNSEDSLSHKSIEADWGIVFHGKITSYKHVSYLVKNIKSVRLASSEISVVVSTYRDEFYLDLRDALQGLDIEIVECQDVGEIGHGYPRSLCQQIETTCSGLDHLLSLKIAKCIKIRVDQKIDVLSTIVLMERLFQAFPNAKENISNRIWTTSYNSYLRRTFGASDMLMVGFTRDLARYWSKISTSDFLSFTSALSQRYPLEDYREFRIPETWLGARYLDSLQVDLSLPEIANKIFWRDYMGVINSAHLNHSWMKSYQWLGSNFHTLNWFGTLLDRNLSEITFEDWVAIYIE